MLCLGDSFFSSENNSNFLLHVEILWKYFHDFIEGVPVVSGMLNITEMCFIPDY